MSNRQRAFSYQPADVSEVQFKINGVKIRGVAEVDGLTLLGYIASLQNNDTSTAGLLQFLQLVVLPEDYPTFQAACTDARMSVEDVTELASWLLEVYTERPTQSPTDTSSGPPTSGSGSKENSSSPVLTAIPQAG